MSFGFFFFKQKTAYELRISDWSSDVCSSDLPDDPSGTRSPEHCQWRTQLLPGQLPLAAICTKDPRRTDNEQAPRTCRKPTGQTTLSCGAQQLTPVNRRAVSFSLASILPSDAPWSAKDVVTLPTSQLPHFVS